MKPSDLRSRPGALRELAELLNRHRRLVRELAGREITDRYAGQLLGAAWAIGHPLVLMGVLTFVFAVVIGVKAEAAGLALPVDYSVYLLAGLIPWLAFQDSMARGVTVVVGNEALVKQAVFPIEVLPVKSALACLLTPVVAFSFFVAYVGVRCGGLYWTYALLPVLLLLQALAMIGVSYLLGAVGAYFRDLKDLVLVFSLANLYLMPVVYLPASVPALFRPFLYANPFSYMVWCYQDACYFGRFEHPWAWAVFAGLSLGVLAAGYLVFRRLKPMFGNVV